MDKLIIPTELYGRDNEIKWLLDLFEHISGGYGELLLIPGSSGVGKTALVQELQTPVKERNGFFVSGKFEQFQQNIPYSAFRQAMSELCQKLHFEDESHHLQFKEDILQSVGGLGQVLIDFVPEFESFLGPQPPVGDTSPQEARHRFADVFQNFLKVVCRPEHPLVLFLDDWQWADSASCELLRQLQVGNTLRYMLVIVSYRSNEIQSAHLFNSAIIDMRRRNISIEELHVKNISAEDVQKIVFDSLSPSAIDAKELSAIIYQKTEGNPFFVRSFLNYLSEFDIIRFDNTAKVWSWRKDLTQEVDLPDNVVELFAMKLRRLDPESRNLFFLAACLGNRFELETLCIISDRSSEECLTLLWGNRAKTLLLPNNNIANARYSEDNHIPKTFAFLHDKVQQAAFSLIDSDELPGIQLKIGRLLLARLHPDQLDERLFEVMNDLNAGSHLIDDVSEQMKVVELNLVAARKAYTGTAYLSALGFYHAAARFIEKPGFSHDLWMNQHDLILNYYKERAVCEFLEGDRHEAERSIAEAVSHSDSAVEKAQALNIFIVHYTLLSRYPEAIEAGQQALSALGITLPDDNFEAARDKEIGLVKKKLENRKIISLADLPIMKNSEMLMASRILITMGPPCYRSHQKLWSVIVPKVVNLTLRYGNIPQVGYSHTAFGGLIGWVDDDFSIAKAFSEVATHLMSSIFRSPSDQSIFYLMIGSSNRHWFKHLRYSTQDYTDAYQIGLRSGNLQYAAYAFGHNMYCRFYQGVPLSGLIKETQHSLDFSRTRLNQWAIDILEGGLNIFGILAEESSSFEGSIRWSDEAFLQRIEEHQNIQVKCIYNVLKTFVLLVSGKDEDALSLSDKTEPLIYTVGTQGLLPWPEHVFTRFLILTGLYSKADSDQQLKWRFELDAILKKLYLWAENGPDNFGHKYHLAAAEMARMDGRMVEAISLYDKALEGAQSGNFLQWEALANERAYGFWMEYGNERLAYVYWQQAYVCYKLLGAGAKVFLMENAYRAFIGENLPAGSAEKGIHKDIVEKHIVILRNYALQMQQTKLRLEAEMQADELAHATQRLRIEISDRKKAEEEIKNKNKELQILNATKDKFFSIIAHDLRSPFNSILGFSNILIDQIKEKDYSENLKYAEIIRQSAGTAMDLLMNLMEWARSQTGRVDYNPVSFDIEHIIKDVEILFADIAKQKSIEISKKLPSGIVVFADQSMLSTILRNLISNAIKFTEPGGNIIISAEKDANEVVVSVTDSGIGISQSNVDELFRIDKSYTTSGTLNEQGTGLGLVLCKEFVETHGGKIRVESEEGKGSVFYFTLPDHDMDTE